MSFSACLCVCVCVCQPKCNLLEPDNAAYTQRATNLNAISSTTYSFFGVLTVFFPIFFGVSHIQTKIFCCQMRALTPPCTHTATHPGRGRKTPPNHRKTQRQHTDKRGAHGVGADAHSHTHSRFNSPTIAPKGERESGIAREGDTRRETQDTGPRQPLSSTTLTHVAWATLRIRGVATALPKLSGHSHAGASSFRLQKWQNVIFGIYLPLSVLARLQNKAPKNPRPPTEKKKPQPPTHHDSSARFILPKAAAREM